MFVRSAERGQTIAESLIFLPVALLLLFGVIYVSQYGVISERAYLAARYAGNVQAVSQLYSAENIYSNLSTTSGGSVTVTKPTACATPATTYMTQGTPFTGATSPPYWQPTSSSSSCSLNVYQISAPGEFTTTQYIFEGSVENVSATYSPAGRVPYLAKIIDPTNAGLGVTASEVFLQSADPAMLLYCSPALQTGVNNSLNASVLSVAPNPQSWNGWWTFKDGCS
jgi:hypothetical protein